MDSFSIFRPYSIIIRLHTGTTTTTPPPRPPPRRLRRRPERQNENVSRLRCRPPLPSHHLVACVRGCIGRAEVRAAVCRNAHRLLPAVGHPAVDRDLELGMSVGVAPMTAANKPGTGPATAAASGDVDRPRKNGEEQRDECSDVVFGSFTHPTNNSQTAAVARFGVCFCLWKNVGRCFG